MLLSMVDVIFADVAQPDQARIVAYNAQSFLKDQGHIIISIKASCIDSTVPPETIFASEVEQLKRDSFKPLEQVTLEPYERDHAMVTGMSCAKADRINIVKHDELLQRNITATANPHEYFTFNDHPDYVLICSATLDVFLSFSIYLSLSNQLCQLMNVCYY